MQDLNSVNLVGRLVADPKVKDLRDFSLMAMTVATNSFKKTANGYDDEASFIDVNYFLKQNDQLPQWLKKGSRVALNGRLKQERWEKDGEKKSRIIINASKYRYLIARMIVKATALVIKNQMMIILMMTYHFRSYCNFLCS